MTRSQVLELPGRMPSLITRCHGALRDVGLVGDGHDGLERSRGDTEFGGAGRLLALVAAVDDPRLKALGDDVTAHVVAAVLRLEPRPAQLIVPALDQLS